MDNVTRLWGTVSGLLFIFYINSLLREISNLPQGCVLAGSKMNIICYADDTLFLTSSSTGLQTLLNKPVYRLNELSLKVNTQKPSYILFKCKYQVTGHEIFLDGRKLNQVSKCIYLGVTPTGSKSINEDPSVLQVYSSDNFMKFFDIYMLRSYYVNCIDCLPPVAPCTVHMRYYFGFISHI